MARKALLIGSQTEGLFGVDNDVKAMASALQQWDFVITRCEAENASRAGILDAYERLILDAQEGDAIVVYYSGHGGSCLQPDYDKVIRPREALQFIVPADYPESREGDFRGILSLELSQLQQRLVEKTRNVTTILDCCHAGTMARDPNLRVKSIGRRASYAMITAHLDGLKRRHVPDDLWRQFGSPEAVRLVACGPEESANEGDNAAGDRQGMFTDELTRVLAEAKAHQVTWSTVVDRVRKRVLTRMPSQRPDVEGPARRLLFDLAEADPVATLPVIDLGNGRARLEGGPLLGVQVGDELAVMPADSTGPDDATKIADIQVDRLTAMAALGRMRLKAEKLELGARAHRVKAAATRLAVRVPAADAGCAALVQAVEQARLVRPAEPDEQTPYEVRTAQDGGFVVCDRVGPLHVTPRKADAAGVGQVVADLHRLAQASALRSLAEDPDHRLRADVTVEFGLAEAGEKRPLARAEEQLYLGQRIYVRVHNKSEQPIFVSLLDIGVAGRVAVMNRFAPGGVQIGGGKEYVFGWNEMTDEFTGLPLTWPKGLPGEKPRPETIFALITSMPQDVRFFEQEGVGKGHAKSALECLFEQIAGGGARDLVTIRGSDVRYQLRTIDFDLLPVGPPAAEKATFQVDERPHPTMRLYTPKGAVPKTVAVRMTDLTVHRNRALRNADIRLDAMILTGASAVQPAYHARTERFCDIRDGQRLPMDRMLVYHGPAVDYLDIAVWVTRDRKGSLDLSDLLREKLNDPAAQAALAQAGGLLLAAPQTAAAVAAIGAGAILINTAYELLSGIVGDSIGVYRTTLLAHEGFGTGRTAEQNTVRAQDFSFAYTVENVSDR